MVDNRYSSYCLAKQFFLLTKKPILKNIYRGSIPKRFRKKIELFVDLKQQFHTAKYFREFIDLYFSNILERFTLKPVKQELIGKKIIWQYWAQGIKNSPDLVKVCFSSVDRFKGEYEVIRLDDSNLKEYLDLPEFIYNKKNSNPNFNHAFFSDLIRLALLDIYGGVWLDATIFLTGKISDKLLESDYFMFQRDLNAKDKEKWRKYDIAYFNWSDKHRVNVLNSFIISRPHDLTIHTLLDILMNFWKTQENVPHYFFFQIMYNEIINSKYLKDRKCKIIDDTIPHLLHYNLNNKFDNKEFNLIKEKTHIHKLRYINKVILGSYCDHIINEKPIFYE